MHATTATPPGDGVSTGASPSREDTDAAVDAFVAASWSRLYRTAFLLTGDPHEAEDAVQTALAVVVERWSMIRRTDDPIVYARRVLATTAYRRTRRRRDELQRLLRLRATVVLRFYADLGERETAEVLGCSVGTVKSQTSKGLDRLRRDLDPEELR